MKTDRSRAAEVLEALNTEQRAVATSFGAPVVVLAGAGTGKTRAITHRIAYGAFTGQIDPSRTLAVTFTNKAAGELRHRLQGLGVPRVQARTFHSAALRQITYFWPTVNGSEIPQVTSSTYGLIAEAARGIGASIETPLLRELAGEISWTKVSNIAPDRYAELAGRAGRSVNGLDPERVADVLQRYEQVKRRREVIDFDDILLCAIALLHEHPEVAEKVRDQYRHFTVDEYQDVSPVQRTLLDLWVADNPDLCVVGDVNQAIHTFAGAKPSYLTNFCDDHPGARTLTLEINYRSTPQVIEAANALVGRGARLRATRSAGPAVLVAPASDEQSEARDVATWLTGQHDAGQGWSQLAVLYRINAQSQVLQDELSAAGVPFTIRDPEARSAGRPPVPLDPNSEAVTLSTMHSAKGLEWESVAVVGLSENLMPFVLASTPSAQAEERRLLYVAFTRARTWLRLSWATQGASGRGSREPSRYLRSAGLVEAETTPSRAPRQRTARRPRALPNCHVCGQAMSETADIKLGRHQGCPASFDEELFEKLRSWRWGVAQTQAMPAFVIFTDATLRALAEQRPGDRPGLLRIAGIGSAKADRHGDDVLALIAEHVRG